MSPDDIVWPAPATSTIHGVVPPAPNCLEYGFGACLHASRRAVRACCKAVLPTAVWRGLGVSLPRTGRLTVAKAFFFTWMASRAAYTPFISLFFSDRGLTAGEIGAIGAARPFVSIIGTPLWSMVADRTGRHRAILIWSLVLSAALMVVLGYAHLDYVTPFATAYVFYVVLASTSDFIGSPAGPLVDNSVMELLGSEPQRYGEVRMWAGIGYGSFAVGSGFVVNWYGDYQIVFAMLLLLMIPTIALVLRFRVATPHKLVQPALANSGTATDQGSPPAEDTAAKSVEPMLKPHPNTRRSGASAAAHILVLSPAVSATFLVVLVQGIGLGMLGSFEPLRIAELGGAASLVGAAVGVACGFEVVMMYFSARIIKRYSAGLLLALSCLALVVRLVAFALATAPWMLLAADALHSLCWGLFWPVAMNMARTFAPEGLTTTTIAIMTAVHMGVGVSVGNAVFGNIFAQYGSRTGFLAAAAAVGLGLAVFCMVGCCCGWSVAPPDPGHPLGRTASPDKESAGQEIELGQRSPSNPSLDAGVATDAQA